MSVLDDFRKAIQDFIAPELRSLNVQLEALRREMKLNHEAVMTALNLDKRMAIIEDRLQREQKPTN